MSRPWSLGKVGFGVSVGLVLGFGDVGSGPGYRVRGMECAVQGVG